MRIYYAKNVELQYPKQKQPCFKKVRSQSEARLQAAKTSDIKEGQEDKTFYFYRNDTYFTGYFLNYN